MTTRPNRLASPAVTFLVLSFYLYRRGPRKEEEVHDILDPLAVHGHQVDDLSGRRHSSSFAVHCQGLKWIKLTIDLASLFIVRD